MSSNVPGMLRTISKVASNLVMDTPEDQDITVRAVKVLNTCTRLVEHQDAELERHRALVADLQRRILGGIGANDQNDRHGYSAPTWVLLSSVLTQHGFDPARTAGGER